MANPRLWILAGPNGAGKTTYARANLPDFIASDRFVNADEVARNLSPDNPEGAALAAARSVLEQRAALIRRRESFAIETTLASRTLLRAITQARVGGYEAELTFLYISDVDLCVERVARRVFAGGHFIPAEVIARRYTLGLHLLPAFVEACDFVQIMAADEDPFPIAVKDPTGLTIHEPRLWARVLNR
jgi:predicted ABC-type ATPase